MFQRHFFLLTLLIYFDQSYQTTEYIAATTNPPHGCPNYGLCTDVTTTLVSSDGTTDVYQYGCDSDDCVCVSGVTNTTTTCDTIVDQCSNDPCGSDTYFLCTTDINSYSCTCQSGYTGSDCTTEINSACGTSPCQNGGTCNVSNTSSSGYTCACKSAYLGDNCEYYNICAGSPCKNGGNCSMVLDNSNYYCQCNSTYQGRKCETTNLVAVAPIEDGCYKYDSAITSATLKFSDTKMTVEMCDAYAAKQSTTMNYLTLCGTYCVVSVKPVVNTTASDIACKLTCGGNSSELCGKTTSRCIVYSATTYDTDTDACAANTSLCNADTGNGVCINNLESSGTSYVCACGALWTGSDCETAVAPACDSQPCNNGTCVLNTQWNTYTCVCDDGYTGTNCEYTDVCNSTVCLYGGTCSEDGSGGFTCKCLSLYSGTQCEEINRCNYSDPCVNGDCSTTVDGIIPDYNCTCSSGWTGVNCDTMIDYCDPNPCQYNSTCNPYFKGYNCTCLTGLTDKNCSTIIDLCVGYWSNKKWIASPCNTKDSSANCTKGINTFTCSCSSDWTDTLCDLNALIKDVLLAIYGYVDLTMISLLNDLMTNPAEIKDMAPFITGLLPDTGRPDLSWDVEDLFNWIAFEDKRLDLNKDLYKWNDVVLGNCFTFNHQDQNFTFLTRSSGTHGGILAFMKVRQDEYLPWYDTAAINVFIHNRHQYVFSESVRYNAEPNAQSTINVFMGWYNYGTIQRTRYTRLGGKYGKCVTETSEVKNYYYPGEYTTDGCLRTCYQDMIMEECGCMDPRYPKANNATSCQLSERSCVTEASDSAGDPSTWSSCVCPLPCSNQEHSATWSKVDFPNLPISCVSANNVTGCQSSYMDNLMVSIVIPKMDFKIYAETPFMDFNKFLSQLGGQLGVLMGINLVTFIEIAFLFIGLLMVCCRKS